MAIIYPVGESAGASFETYPLGSEIHSVVVTDEALDKISGFEGDNVNYTATVKDDLGAALPDTFVVDLKINGIVLIAGQILDASVYNPATFLLTLPWIVPAEEGIHTVKISWAEQVI